MTQMNSYYPGAAAAAYSSLSAASMAAAAAAAAAQQTAIAGLASSSPQQVGSSLDPARYSVEAEKYRAAAGYHNLYGSADPMAAAAAAKYLETSNKGDEGSKPDSSYSQGGNDNSTSSSDGINNSSSSAASKAYLESAKLYMDSKNYAAEVQRAYMDAAAKSIYGESGKDHHQQGGVSDGSADIKNERGDGSSPPGFNPATLANYYSQAAAAAAAAGASSNPAGLAHQTSSALSGIVPLYPSPAGTYPSSGEYRRPLPVLF